MSTYTVISRKSNLAKLQVDEVITLLKEAGATATIKKLFIDTIGDQDKKTALIAPNNCS